MSERTVVPPDGGLPPWYPSRGFDKDPLGVMDHGHDRHGPVFRMTVDGAETVLVGTSAGLGELFASERGHLAVLNTALVHDLFDQAVFNLVGDGHTAARRRLGTALSGRALSGYVLPLLEGATQMSIMWAEHGVVDLYAAAREVTLAMSAQVLLGIEPGEPDAAVFAADFGRFVAATDVHRGRRRFAEARYWAGRRARRRLHALFTRRAASAAVGVDPGSALPGLADAFEDASGEAGLLADHLLALLIAARETTASLVTWCLIELACHRDHADLAAPEAHAAMTEPGLLVRRDALPVLRAVLAETLRMHSPNLLSMREAVCPVELGGYRVPAGMRVAYSPSAGHFDPEVFPQPHTFRPERFLAGPVPRARLWAFGGGVHACLGRPLAELMTVTALASVLHQGLPRLPGGPPGPLRYRPCQGTRRLRAVRPRSSGTCPVTRIPPDALAVLRWVAAHHETSRKRLHLVPSENGLSLAARVPHLMEAAIRYAFPGPDGGGENWAWPGRQDLVDIERAAAVRLGAQLSARHVNLKSVSGVSALTVALSALARPGETVFNLAERDGGHGSTRFIGTRLGLPMKDLPVDSVTCTLDLDALAQRLDGAPPPELVYLDAFMCLFPMDLPGLRDVVGPETVIHYDASHTLGLIAGGAWQNPLAEGADTLGGSTHKTYPGPHKGLLATNDAELAARFDEHASYFVSHHHPADVVALAVAAAEMDARGATYAHTTVANARRLGAALAERGFTVCGEKGGFTDCHQLWIDIAPLMAAEEASRRLVHAGIVVNAIPLPHVAAPAGLRLGVQEVSWAGMGKAEMDELAEIFTAVLRDGQDSDAVAARTQVLVEAHRPADGDDEQVLRVALAAAGVEGVV